MNKSEIKKLNENTLSLSFGMLSDPLAVQLRAQGFKFHSPAIKRFQRNVNSINDLRMSDLINESSLQSMHQKLFKKISEHINKVNFE